MSKLAAVRAHLFQIRIAFLRYHSGWQYLWMRYVVAPSLARSTQALERDETRSDLSMHILTGHRDVLIMLWSLASFYAVSKTIGSLTVHSDGSLTTKDRALIARLFPHARILEKGDLALPARSAFKNLPQLNSFFDSELWQARKLLDPYLAATRKYILLLDTDVLWFRNPEFLGPALEVAGSQVFTMSNNEECMMPFLDGTFLEGPLARINTGVVFFEKTKLNLARLEEYLVQTGAVRHHFLEQAGYAYALEAPTELPPELYTIKGVMEKDAIMRHYTGPVRGKFFIRGIPYLLAHHILHVRN